MVNQKAFPTLADNGHSENQDGMNLRDYFAAKAMQAIIVTDEDIDYTYIAAVAYEMADEMIGYREQ